MVATGREVFRCRTGNGPAVVVAEEAAGEEDEVDGWTMSTGTAAVGIHPAGEATGTVAEVADRPAIVPECQRMGMVKAEANNTIHRKPFTKNDTPASIDHPNRRGTIIGRLGSILHKTTHKQNKAKHKHCKHTQTALVLGKLLLSKKK